MKLDIIGSLKRFYSDSRHVMSVSYRPDVDTFTRTLKIVILGALALGIMGFIIAIIIGAIAS